MTPDMVNAPTWLLVSDDPALDPGHVSRMPRAMETTIRVPGPRMKPELVDVDELMVEQINALFLEGIPEDRPATYNHTMTVQDPVWLPQAPTIESWSGDIKATKPLFAFPIGPVGFNEDGSVTLDKNEFGTCFFIGGSVFLTAWHVVEKSLQGEVPIQVLLLHGDGDEPSSVSCEQVIRVERVSDLDGRETDIAMGFIGTLPPDKRVPRVQLSSALATPGSYVAGYGYARTQWREFDNKDGEPEMAMNVTPRFCRGTIGEHVPEGRGFTKWPHYTHNAETGGGISGGPLFDMTTKRVCGVNSTGGDKSNFSTAVDLRVVLDWPIPFAKQRTLRSLAAEGFVDLA